jgi:hypothetical protein
MSDQDEEELILQPIDPETELARQSIMETQLPCVTESTEESPSKIQFGIFHVLVVMTVVAGFASLTQWLSNQAILTIIGLFAFFSLLLIRVSESPHPLIRFAWWCLFVVYLGFVLVVAVSAGQRF